jgi:hypothetical protein
VATLEAGPESVVHRRTSDEFRAARWPPKTTLYQKNNDYYVDFLRDEHFSSYKQILKWQEQDESRLKRFFYKGINDVTPFLQKTKPRDVNGKNEDGNEKNEDGNEKNEDGNEKNEDGNEKEEQKNQQKKGKKENKEKENMDNREGAENGKLEEGDENHDGEGEGKIVYRAYRLVYENDIVKLSLKYFILCESRRYPCVYQ